jgi:guanylate kinase
MRGFVVILSAPSGAGKSTICRQLLQRNPRLLRYSISCTTRAPRPGEKDGQHYFFIDRDQFRQKVKENAFLEWALVHDEYYGTPRSFVEATTGKGHNVLLAIDVQGAMAIKKQWPEAVLVFVFPPSWRALRGRLDRRRDAKDSVEKRLKAAKQEVLWADRYDYWVVNDRLPKAVRRIEAVLTAEAMKPVRARAVPQVAALLGHGPHASRGKRRAESRAQATNQAPGLPAY